MILEKKKAKPPDQVLFELVFLDCQIQFLPSEKIKLIVKSKAVLSVIKVCFDTSHFT